jgi:hypothetical protein
MRAASAVLFNGVHFTPLNVLEIVINLAIETLTTY